eukprot:gene4287-8524_t
MKSVLYILLSLYYVIILNSDLALSTDFPRGYPHLEWVHIDDGPFWVYGAFWDNRSRDIIGVKLSTYYVRLYITGPYRHQKFIPELKRSSCEYSFSNLSSTRVALATVQLPNFDWNNPRSGAIHFYAYCNLPESTDIPMSVSIITNEAYSKPWRADNEGRRRKFLLPIRRPDILQIPITNHNPPKKLAMCTKPFYGNWASFKDNNGLFDPIEQIINLFVFYSSLGVEHFILYDQGTTSAKVYSILNLVHQSGISLEILPWNFREKYGYGMFQTVSIESCIHRCMGLYENVLIGDFDELIVPKLHQSLPSLIDALDLNYPKASHYKFSSTNFYSFLPNTNYSTCTTSSSSLRRQKSEETNKQIIEDLFILRKFNRTLPYPYSRGTKCIIKPYRISEAGIHDALPVNNLYETIEVPFEMAAVHHYRDDYVDPSKYEDTTNIDDSVLKFVNSLSDSKFYKLVKANGYI